LDFKKFLIVFFALFFLGFVYSIAVVPPVFYVASLSIIGLVSNVLISLAVFIAAGGVFGVSKSKGFSSKLDYFLGILGKSALLFFSCFVSVFFVRPIALPDAIIAGLVALVISFFVLFFSFYHRAKISSVTERHSLFFSVGVFLIFVFFAASFAGYFSIELKEFNPAKGDFVEQKSSSPLLDMVSSISSNASSSAPVMKKSLGESTGQASSTAQEKSILVLYPSSSEPCLISTENGSFSFAPKFDCVVVSNGIRSKAFCPIVVNLGEVGQVLSSSGSCIKGE
jgi:hypothetical protein